MRDSTRYTDVEYVVLDISEAVSAAVEYIDMQVSDLSWNLEQILEMHPVYRMAEGDNDRIQRMIDDMLRRGYVSNQDDADVIARFMITETFPRINLMLHFAGYPVCGIARATLRRSRRNGVVCQALLSVI